MASLNFLAALHERVTFWGTSSIAHLRYYYRLRATDSAVTAVAADLQIATQIESRPAPLFQRPHFLDYLHGN